VEDAPTRNARLHRLSQQQQQQLHSPRHGSERAPNKLKAHKFRPCEYDIKLAYYNLEANDEHFKNLSSHTGKPQRHLVPAPLLGVCC
jgi:hypothetical protein